MKKLISFEVHYHGSPILVGQKYSPGDLHAHLIFSDGEFRDVRSVDFRVNNTYISHTGQNSFIATYEYNGKTFIDYFIVYGYTNKRYINKEFRIFLVDDLTEIDVTEKYGPRFFNVAFDNYYITANNLYKQLDNGIYRFILPQDTGLCYQYSTEWKVIRTDDAAKFTLTKIYNEEE